MPRFFGRARPQHVCWRTLGDFRQSSRGGVVGDFAKVVDLPRDVGSCGAVLAPRRTCVAVELALAPCLGRMGSC